MQPASREPPDEKGVDRAEQEMTRPRGRARSRYAVEYPGDLRGRKIGVEQQPGLVRDFRFHAALVQFTAALRRSAVLPDDGIEDRDSAASIPDDGGFALIGDADGGDRGAGFVKFCEQLARRRQHRGPDYLRIVFHPARRGVDLLESLLLEGHCLALKGKAHRTAGTGALIDCK